MIFFKVQPLWMHVDVWQNQYNIVKQKNKIKTWPKKKKKIESGANFTFVHGFSLYPKDHVVLFFSLTK